MTEKEREREWGNRERERGGGGGKRDGVRGLAVFGEVVGKSAEW